MTVDINPNLNRPYVNATNIAKYMGSKVTIIGHVSEIHPTGHSFNIVTSNNSTVHVQLVEGLEPVLGLVEVIGTVLNGPIILGEEITQHETESLILEDMMIFYDQMVDALEHCPDLWAVPSE